MIKSVEFSGASETPYSIEMVKPDPEGLIIKGIEGLGAGVSDIHQSDRASMDGNVFNGARLGARNIVFSMGFGNRLDPETGREISYAITPIKEKITMKFVTTRKTVLIDGYVESNEPEIFTNEPAFQVSVLCVEDPYFRSPLDERVITRLYGFDQKFEFPFSNESLTTPRLNLGEYLLDNYVDLRYEGTVRTGVTIRFIFIGDGKNPAIMNERTGQSMRIDTAKVATISGAPVKAGDIIEVHTIRGSKYVHLIRDGKRINIINALSRTSGWIEVRPGINPISVYTDTADMQFQTEIWHDNLYQGL